MIENILEKSLIDALSYCALRELPPEDKGEDIWISAVVLLTKRNGTKSYAVVQKDTKGENKILKDFGEVSPIVKIEKVYPYLYLNSNFVPTFDSKKKEDRIKWLQMVYPKRDFSEMSIKELNREIINAAIQNQIKSIKTQQGIYE